MLAITSFLSFLRVKLDWGEEVYHNSLLKAKAPRENWASAGYTSKNGQNALYSYLYHGYNPKTIAKSVVVLGRFVIGETRCF